MVGVWKTIASLNSQLQPFDISLDNLITCKAGNGGSIRFWIDSWNGNDPLSKSFPALFKLEKHKACLINERCSDRGSSLQWEWCWLRPPSSPTEIQQLQDLLLQVSQSNLTTSEDTWIWSIDRSGEFSTKSMRTRIQKATYGPNPWIFPWNRLAPIKVNIMGWRLELNRLPTSDQLHRRNITLGSHICPMCKSHDETTPHLFLNCSFADSLWSFFLSWCKIPINKPSSLRELFTLHQSTPVGKRKRKLINLIILAYCWTIWKLRNESLFNNKHPSFRHATKDLKTTSYQWLANRSKKYNIGWSSWNAFNF